MTACCQFHLTSLSKYSLQINLSFVYLFMGVTINSAVIPIVLSMFWERLTGLAMITGSIGGTVLALITWISVTVSYPGGLKDFKDNAGKTNIRRLHVSRKGKVTKINKMHVLHFLFHFSYYYFFAN